MTRIPSSTLNLIRGELKKLEDREAALKSELAEVTAATNYLRKCAAGAEKMNEKQTTK